MKLEFLLAAPDANLLYVGSYRPGLVVISILLAVFASYAALNVSPRIAQAESHSQRLMWVGVGSLAMGGGVWAMHFIGMLSLSLPCGVAYDPFVTLLSTIPGILASGVALGIIGNRHAGRLSLLIGSVLLGAGIGTMHYMGMSAMRLDGFLRYDPKLFVLSILVAMVLAYLALKVNARTTGARRGRDLFSGSVIMGGAISGMHYTAMSATYFVRGNLSASPAPGLSTDYLAAAVVVVTGLIATLAIAVTAAYRNLEMAHKLKEREEALRETNQKLEMIIQSAPLAIYIRDIKGIVTSWNPAAEKLFGWSAAEILGRPLLTVPKDKAGETEGLRQRVLAGENIVQAEVKRQRKDGSLIDISTTLSALRDSSGEIYGYLAIVADITEKKKSAELIWQQANFDPLTGLPNRRMFLDRLELEVRKAHRTALPVAVMFLDLDRFKDVNDTLGHDMGDVLLKEAAERLASCVRESDTVARLGGDEFGVILGELADPGSVERVAEDILRKLAEPFRLGMETAFVSASIGVTLYPADAVEIDALIRNADQAMYAAKHQGRNSCHYFTQFMQESAQLRMRLANDLRGALAGGQLLLHYQPIVELRSGVIDKAEALIRWQHPLRGLVSPTQFIPIAEDTGLIVDIGDWVFREAARQAGHWRATQHALFQVSVNVSPVQFRSEGNRQASWFEYLRQLGLSGQSIVVEITEGMLLDASATVSEQLLVFRDAGVQVSLDDFGTGYSSLSYLKKFDIDYLKIDQSFVRNLVADSDDMALCEAIIMMAHKLGLKVIAEGVETQPQRDLLAGAGCDYAQGYWFSRPIPASELELLLARQSKADCSMPFDLIG